MYDLAIQAISLVGSILILVAFIAAQLGKMRTNDAQYIALNLLGSSILAVVAVLERQWGFLLLEGTWAIVSVWSLAKMGSAE